MKLIKSSELLLLFINKHIQDPFEYIFITRLANPEKGEF